MNSNLKNKSPLPNNNFARIASAKYDFSVRRRKQQGLSLRPLVLRAIVLLALLSTQYHYISS